MLKITYLTILMLCYTLNLHLLSYCFIFIVWYTYSYPYIFIYRIKCRFYIILYFFALFYRFILTFVLFCDILTTDKEIYLFIKFNLKRLHYGTYSQRLSRNAPSRTSKRKRNNRMPPKTWIL